MASSKRIDKKILEERVRQLLAVDTMAMNVYTDLAKNVEDQDLKDIFSKIAGEENTHIALSREILSLLNGQR